MSQEQTAVSTPKPEPEPRTILLVDDEADILHSLAEFLENAMDRVRVIAVPSGAEAVATMEREPVDLIISDYRMPGMDGVTFLRRARELAPEVPRFMLTAYPQLSVATKAIHDAEIHQYLMKPVEPTEILQQIEAALNAPAVPPLEQHVVDALFSRLGSGATPAP